ncbi:putative protein disulfide-isomerase, partial [Schistosoma mansoni]
PVYSKDELEKRIKDSRAKLKKQA